MTGAIIAWCLIVGVAFASGSEDSSLGVELRSACFYLSIAHWVIAIATTAVLAWRVA